MRQIIISIIYSCLFFTVTVQAQTANTDLLRQLLDLPSPPPENRVTDTRNEEPKRPSEFYSEKHVPKDDAPIEDLIDYWSRKNNDFDYKEFTGDISAETIKRLVEFAKEKPKRLKDFLNILPSDESVGKQIKNVFDISQNADGIDDDWRKEVRKWLKYNSKVYLNELIAEAEQARDHKTDGDIINDNKLKALARIDWESAEPILNRLKNDSVNIRTSTFAKTLIYKKAITEKDNSLLEKYRKELKEILLDRNMPAKARDMASDALFETDWNGQEGFYLSLLKDETLLHPQEKHQLFSPLETLPLINPDKWIPILAKLVEGNNMTVRNAAVQSLVGLKRKDSLIPLLPWLSNPDWAKINWSPGGRTTLMQIVSRFDIPESVPGLIWIIENEDDEAHWAADSLAKFKDSRAIPALKNALERIKDEEVRRKLIYALLACSGLTDIEQLKALEIYANKISTPEGYKDVEESYRFGDENPLPVQISIGKFIANQREPSEDLIRLAIERQKVLKKEDPLVAKILSDIMQRWKGRLVDLELLKQIETGTADVETVVGALARREELRKNVLNDIYAMSGKSGLANGISACLSGTEIDLLGVLGSNNNESVISVLACSRLIRAKLPVPQVGALLESDNKLLALAAERYLESEDSLESRELVLTKYNGQAKILGARHSFNPAKKRKSDLNSSLFYLFRSIQSQYELTPDYGYVGLIGTTKGFEKTEEKLRKEILGNAQLTNIFAFQNHIIRVFEDKIVYRWHLDEARYQERILSKEEFDKFYNSLIEKDVFNLSSIRGRCHHNCVMGEFLILNKNGGRRLFMFAGFQSFAPFANLFVAMQKDDAKLNYHLSKKIKGLEVLFADKTFNAKAVWKNGNDFRVLVEDVKRKEQIHKEIAELDKIDDDNEDLDYDEESKRSFNRKAERAFEHFEWRKFEDGKLTERVSEPDQIPYLKDRLSFPSIKDLKNNETTWQSKVGNYEIRSGEYNKGGLWKVNRSGHFQFLKGLYSESIITPDKKWAVVSATDNESWAGTDYVTRINLKTNKKYKVNLPEADYFDVITFVPAHNKVLIRRSRDTYYEKGEKDNPSPKTPEYFLLDANTGKTQLVKGEFRPLEQQTFRPLQSTESANEFWAAIPSKNQTEIGRYNSKTFSFKTILTIPQIKLTSMDIWLDKKESRVFFIYSGRFGNSSHLLSLPLLNQ